MENVKTKHIKEIKYFKYVKLLSQLYGTKYKVKLSKIAQIDLNVQHNYNNKS